MNGLYHLLDFLLPFSWISPTFMKNAFLAMLVACPLFAALGTQVVSNKMAFFSDAIGHSALTGIAFGLLLGISEPTISMLLFAFFLGFSIITVKIKGSSSSDTIIGVFSSAAVALGIVLLSAMGNFAKYQRYLVGDILSITPKEILFLACGAVALVLVWLFFYNKMLLTSLHETFAKSRGINTFLYEQLFALLTAAVVTLGIRWTGLLVINSLLVLPAASSRLLSRTTRQYITLSICIALISGITGLSLSYYIGSASGATIVLVNAGLFILCFIAKITRQPMRSKR